MRPVQAPNSILRYSQHAAARVTLDAWVDVLTALLGRAMRQI